MFRRKWKLYGMEDESRNIENMVRNSDMEYLETHKLTWLDRISAGVPCIAPELYMITIRGTRRQLKALIGKHDEILRVW